MALALLAAFVLLPVLLLFWPREVFRDTSMDYRAPRYAIELADLSYAAPDSEPTVGMEFVASRYGTVMQAPPVRAAMVDPRVSRHVYSGDVSGRVARFVKAWPRAHLIDEGQPGVSTLRMPTDYSDGAYLTLREGCLHVVSPAGPKRFLAVFVGSDGLQRDAEGYLATGAIGGADEYALRIGERGGQIQLGPVEDAQLDGIEALREACGEDPVALVYGAKRLPDCPPVILRERAEAYEREREIAERRQIAGAQCKADYERLAAAERRRGGPATPPPPCFPAPVPPPPPPGKDALCRHPDAAIGSDDGAIRLPPRQIEGG